MTELTLSGIGVLYALMALSIGIAAVIFGLKLWYKKLSNKKQNSNQQNKHLPEGIKSRNKYKDLDVFAISKPIWMFGLGTALMFSLCAFSWVSVEDKVYIPDDPLVIDDEWVIERTAPPKPPAPPPPPPPPIEIEAVKDDLVEDEPDLISMDVDVDTEIVDVEPVIEDTPAPPPPPPPPAAKVVEDIDFVIVEQMPRFPGCEDIDGTKKEKTACAEQKMLEFIYDKTNYPAIARENGIQGQAIIQFVVDKTGAVTKAKIVRDLEGGCGEEALSVINSMPPWTPGKQRGRPVNVLYTIPVRFKLGNR